MALSLSMDLMVVDRLLKRLAFVPVAIACAAPAAPDPCDNIDPALATSSFVMVTEPAAGSRTTTPLRVVGCSRTSESNVLWELRGRDGDVLGSGFATGGGFSGAAPFEFVVEFTVPAAQVGYLDVHAPDESEGEGFPPSRTVLPLVLAPGS